MKIKITHLLRWGVPLCVLFACLALCARVCIANKCPAFVYHYGDVSAGRRRSVEQFILQGARRAIVCEGDLAVILHPVRLRAFLGYMKVAKFHVKYASESMAKVTVEREDARVSFSIINFNGAWEMAVDDIGNKFIFVLP